MEMWFNADYLISEVDFGNPEALQYEPDWQSVTLPHIMYIVDSVLLRDY